MQRYFAGGAGAVLVTAVLIVESSLAGEYRSDVDGYTIQLPERWVQIPDDQLQMVLRLTMSPDAMEKIQFRAGFQDGVNPEWFSYPYALVQVMPYPSGRVPNEENMREMIKAVSGVDMNAEMQQSLSDTARGMVGDARMDQPTFDAETRRFRIPISMTVNGVGPVRGVMAGYFGRDRVVQIGWYAKESDWDAYAQTRDWMIDSFRFLSGHDYQAPGISAYQAGRITGMAITGLIVLGGVVAAVRKMRG